MNPSNRPPKASQQWMSACIPIADIEGQPSINICDAFCHDKYSLGGTLVLPPQIYPPSWRHRHEVENAIITSALENDGTELVRSQTKDDKHSYLCCKFALRHRPKDKENLQGTYRNDRIVNKAKSSRGKQGLKEAKRAQTEKLARKEDLCQFKLRLTCIEGKHWCISKKLKCDACHKNHPRKNVKEDRTPMATLTQENRELAAFTDRVSPSGATQKVIAYATGRAPFSRQQLAHNRNRIENGGDLSDKTDSQKLIHFLQQKVLAKQMRYVALYHEVTATTLLAIDKCHVIAVPYGMNK